MQADLTFAVMGTTAHVIVVDGDPAVAVEAQTLLDALEALWSRFRPDSDISRLNRAGGVAVAVAPATLTLIETAVTAWAATDGLFDPTVHDAVVAAGYDRTFSDLPPQITTRPPPGPSPGCAGIEVDRPAGTVRLPPSVHVDPGGIGKGLAADLAVATLGHRAAGLCVDIGGDLRVIGRSPGHGGWRIGLDGTAVVLTLDEGAVATSSTACRAWTVEGERRHHLMDPRTGQVAQTQLQSVTVVAAEAWWAEAAATTALLGGTAEEALRGLSDVVEAALLINSAGDIDVIGTFKEGRSWTPTPGGTSLAPVASSPGR